MSSASLFSMEVTLDKELWLDEQHLCWDHAVVASPEPLSSRPPLSPGEGGAWLKEVRTGPLLSASILLD